MMKKETFHIDLEEALQVLDSLHEKATQRMIHGTRVHGTEMVRKPFEELQEELADSFNYIVLAFIKTLKSCGGYKDKWCLRRLPDVQKREVKNESERESSPPDRRVKRNRKGGETSVRKKGVKGNKSKSKKVQPTLHPANS